MATPVDPTGINHWRNELATVWYEGRPVVRQSTILAAKPGTNSVTSALPGVVLSGRYRIEHVIGEGAFASVFSACDLTLHRRVAIKVYDDTVGALMFTDEARLQAACQHPNLMPLLDASTDPMYGVAFLVMPLYPGSDLRVLLDWYGPLPFRKAVMCVDQVCSALEFLWQNRQAVHADVKPANIWLTSSGAALLMDFNVYGILARSDSVRVGTPGYTAPEAISGAIDPRSDVFSLGCVLYQCLTGVQPFHDDSDVLSGRFVPASRLREGIRPGLDTIIRTALQANPDRRYPDARAFRSALRSPSSGTKFWGIVGLFLRRAYRLLPFVMRCSWRFARFAFRHPLEALLSGVLVLFILRSAKIIIFAWLATHLKTILLFAVVLALFVSGGVLLRRWRNSR